MKNIWLITQFTIREAMARKIFMIFLAVSTLVIIGFALAFGFIDFNQVHVSNFGKEIKPEQFLIKAISSIKALTVGPLYAGGLFLSIFSTAGIISSLLEKGNIDLFLSKPISRTQLILGKFFGGVLIVFINIAYTIIGIWFLIGLKFSVWSPEFLLSIFSITFAFALIYTLIILATIISRSSVLALILSYLIFFIVSPVLAHRDGLYQMTQSETLKNILGVLHYLIPQTSELGSFSTDIATGNTISSYEPITVSIFLLVLILSSGIIIFNKKDY